MASENTVLESADVKERKFLYWIIFLVSFIIVLFLSLRIINSYFSYNENLLPLNKWFYYPTNAIHNIFDYPPKYLLRGDKDYNEYSEYYNDIDSIMYQYKSGLLWYRDSIINQIKRLFWYRDRNISSAIIYKRFFPNDSFASISFEECEVYANDVLIKKESKYRYFTDFVEDYVKITKLFYQILIGMLAFFFAFIPAKIYKGRSKSIRYVICPHCKKSVLTYYNWRCDFCNHQQGEDKYIYDPCNECGRHIESLICEHCEKEFKL